MTERLESRGIGTFRVLTQRLLLASTVCCLFSCSESTIGREDTDRAGNSGGADVGAPDGGPEVEASDASGRDAGSPHTDHAPDQPPSFPDTSPGTPPGYQAPPPGDAVAVDGVLGLYGESNEFRSCHPDYRDERWAVSAAGSAFTFAHTWYEAQAELELCAVPGNPTACFVYYSGRAVVGELGDMDLVEHPGLARVDRQAVFTELTTLRVAQSLDDCP